MKLRLLRSRRTAAYTLFEIMLVLGIIGVLLTAAIYQLGGQVDQAKYQRVDADVQTFDVALRSYEMMSFSKPTTSQGLEALAVRPTTEPIPKRWLKQMAQVPKDPWNNAYNYSNPGKKNPQGYDFFSSGPDGIPGNDDDWPR